MFSGMEPVRPRRMKCVALIQGLCHSCLPLVPLSFTCVAAAQGSEWLDDDTRMGLCQADGRLPLLYEALAPWGHLPITTTDIRRKCIILGII